jgi:antirestriction protein ArdC
MAMDKSKFKEALAQSIMSALELFPDAKWHRTWDHRSGMPTNAVTGKPYHGGNVFALMGAQWAKGLTGQPIFATDKQWRSLGANIPAEAWKEATQLFFYQFIPEKEDGRGGFPLMKFFWVLHHSQVDLTGSTWKLPDEAVQPPPVQLFETMVAHHKPQILWGRDAAVETVSPFRVHLPHQGDFETPEYFARTSMHEMVHWAGLSQGWWVPFKTWGDETYAAEELIAEIGSYLLCQQAGIAHELSPLSVGYLRGWLRNQDTPEKMYNAVLTAAGKASKRVSFLMLEGVGNESE